MQSSFGIEGMKFEVISVMAQISNDEPTNHLEVTPIEGELVGNKFIIGEFDMIEETYENGDGKLKYNIAFLDKTKDENNVLIADNIATINAIVTDIVMNAFSGGTDESIQ